MVKENVMFRTLWVLIVFAGLTGCDAVPRPLLPYVMDDGDGGTDLYVYDLESGASRLVRATPASHEYDPAIDPTGTRIVYLARSDESGGGQTVYGLFVHELEDPFNETDREFRTRSSPMQTPAWSNDSESVAYVIEAEGKLQIETRELLTASQDTTVIGFGSEPSWRVDDKALFFSSRDRPDAAAGELNVHTLNDGVNRSLRLRGNGFANLPRGTSIAYTTLPYTRRNAAVWLLDANNRKRRLSSPGKLYTDADPVHIVGTTFVAFTRTEVATNRSAIYVVDRAANNPVETRLFEADANVYTKGGAFLQSDTSREK
jgi:dipeptidyl aminopeptidase/acylaminoacyl peptidase